MKHRIIALALSITAIFTSCESLQKLSAVLTPSNIEMAMGLKQALEQGLFKTFDAFKNPQVNPALAFILPNDAQKITNTLNNLGFGSYVDKVTGKFNQATSDAVTAAKPIFLNSLRNMTITDAAKILITNNSHAATDYFKATTKTELVAAFRPIADSTIKVQGADKEWSKVVNVINNVPFVNIKLENSLTDFIAARAVDGMYLMVAQEEEKIRQDVSFRQTDLIKRVFGYADEQLKLKGTTSKAF